MRLDDVLKGPGRQGDTGTVFSSSCGPFIDPSSARQQAPSFIGQTRLFMGSIDAQEALVAYSEVVTPQGLSAQQQYELALRLTGHNPGVHDASGTIELPWALMAWALGIVAAVVATGVVLIIRRRRVQT